MKKSQLASVAIAGLFATSSILAFADDAAAPVTGAAEGHKKEAKASSNGHKKEAKASSNGHKGHKKGKAGCKGKKGCGGKGSCEGKTEGAAPEAKPEGKTE